MRITYFEILGDVKTEYVRLRQDGKSRNAAVQILIAKYHDELSTGAEDDGLLFWVGLADAQYALKELSDEVSTRGLASLEQLKIAIPEITPGDIERRFERYACAPMPERSRVRPVKRFCCQWRIGDTFAYRLSGPNSKTTSEAEEYVLIRKVDESRLEGRLLPVVTLTHWKKPVLPLDEVEFQSTPILRLCNGRLDSPQSTYEYRIEILFTSQKQVNDLDLQYLGNFPDAAIPEDEFYLPTPGCILMLSPKDIDKELEFYCYTLQNYYSSQ